MKHVEFFEELRKEDVDVAGGKGANLGELTGVSSAGPLDGAVGVATANTEGASQAGSEGESGGDGGESEGGGDEDDPSDEATLALWFNLPDASGEPPLGQAIMRELLLQLVKLPFGIVIGVVIGGRVQSFV